MKKYIVAFMCAGALGLLVGATAGAQSELTPQEKVLKKELSKAWDAAARALQKKDYNEYLQVVDMGQEQISQASAISPISPISPISKEEWPQASAFLSRVIRPGKLNDPHLTFVTVKEKGMWAAHYVYYPDPESPGGRALNLDMALFHKVGGIWKLTPKNYGNHFTKKGTDAENRQEALTLIEQDPNFRLPLK